MTLDQISCDVGWNVGPTKWLFFHKSICASQRGKTCWFNIIKRKNTMDRIYIRVDQLKYSIYWAMQSEMREDSQVPNLLKLEMCSLLLIRSMDVHYTWCTISVISLMNCTYNAQFLCEINSNLVHLTRVCGAHPWNNIKSWVGLNGCSTG